MVRAPHSLGARPPRDRKHVERFGFASLAPALTPAQVDAKLERGVRSQLPSWHPTHDQARPPSCVGHAWAMERAIVNLAQRRARRRKPYTVRYDPVHLWNTGKDRDEWPESHSGESEYGTSLRAVGDVLRTEGAVPIRGMRLEGDVPEPWGKRPLSRTAGITEVNRWCRSVDEIRRAFAEGYLAVVIALPWYTAFEPWNLEQRPDGQGRSRSWVRSDPLSYGGGGYRGFHAMCLFGADDRVDALWLKNSHGDAWGQRGVALLPYETLDQCFQFWAEGAVSTDR